MSSTEAIGTSDIAGLDATAPNGTTAKPEPWSGIRGVIVRFAREFALLKLSILGLLGTLIGGYFQSLTAYQDKVSAQAKDDMTAATDTFTDISNTLSTAITLQSLLFYDFVHASKLDAGGDNNALTSKNAQDLYRPYEEAAASLHENINLIARKAEMRLDWASNLDRDPSTSKTFWTDRISTSMLGTVDFDCDNDMPKFERTDHTIEKAKNGQSLTIDWYSAKHHVLTIAYCFDVTHQVWMETVRQWASQSSLPPNQIAKFFSDNMPDLVQDRLDKDVVRLNDFMGRAMNEIEEIQVKYRPTQFYCSFPGVRETIGLFGKYNNACMPVHLRF
jgi:hypothetical protein